MKRPIITLLTDFGLADYYVGAMKGVILGICPDAQIVDISHQIGPYQIRQAAWMLATASEAFPAGTVHVAVVDPGVGSDRKPIVAEAGGHFWIAPDNGVLSTVLSRAPGAIVREISNPSVLRSVISSTFHGRDIFAPAAAHLASGRSLTEFGAPLAHPRILTQSNPIQLSEFSWESEVVWVDRFGNLVTGFDSQDFAWVENCPFELRAGAGTARNFSHFYAAMNPGDIYVTEGSSGNLEISMAQQDAAVLLQVGAGAKVVLRRL